MKKLGAAKSKRRGSEPAARRGTAAASKEAKPASGKKPAAKKKSATARKTGPRSPRTASDGGVRIARRPGDDATAADASPPVVVRPETAAPRASDPPGNVLYAGRHLKLVARGGWECCERAKATGVVTIVAVTADRRLLLTEQFRPPVGRSVIELPAGLAGDEPGDENEALAQAARRELLEETGYECERMEFLTEGPSSAGMSSEVITFFRATNLRAVGDGGGVGSERIALHAIPLTWIRGWLRDREAAGLLVDPKVYAGLYFLGEP